MAERESGLLARELIAQSCHRQGVEVGQLTIHSDRGPSMMSKPVVGLLASLDIQKSVSRPHVSNDNPFSEAQFKTLKYHPTFPRRFGSIQDARAFLGLFFDWHNREHCHRGIGYMTPHQVHSGQAQRVQNLRQNTLSKAFELHPERFVRGLPQPPELRPAVWINPPKPEQNSARRVQGANEVVMPAGSSCRASHQRGLASYGQDAARLSRARSGELASEPLTAGERPGPRNPECRLATATTADALVSRPQEETM